MRLTAGRNRADNCAAATMVRPPRRGSSVRAGSEFSKHRGIAMPRPNRVAICLYLILSLVLTAASAATAQTYTITDLGTFPGGSVSQGQGINFLGQVAGYARFSNFNAHGFLWSTSHGLKDLGAIPPASHFSVGQAINLFGEVAGYSVYDALLDEHAVLWRGGKLYDLGTLPGGTISTAYGINDRGDIAGFSNGTNIAPHATLWTKGKVARALGTLAGGYYSQGLAINL